MKRIILALVSFALVVVARPSSSAGPYNIIVLSVDTLRADRLGAYGYRKKTSPNIDKLLAKGVTYTDAITNVPLTNPAFASMFTSRYPHEIGAIRNGIPIVDGVVTLAEVLKKKGYHTTAILSNWPLKKHLSKLDRGFDSYYDDFHEKRWMFFNNERDAKGVTAIAYEWLDRRPREPFFAWIHYSDPHAPYEKHKDFPFKGGSRNSANYDSEVAYTDHHIGRLLNRIYAKKLDSRTLIVFLSDHGESLGEHDYTGHGRNLYQPGLQVPLAFIGPGIPKGVKSDAPVQLLDLAPTILGFAGIYSGAAPQLPGADKAPKKPLWVGNKRGVDKLMFSIRYQRWEQYNLARDRGEKNDLVNLGDPGFRKSSDGLLAWYRDWEDKTVVGEINLTAEDVNIFKSLGYMDGP